MLHLQQGLAEAPSAPFACTLYWLIAERAVGPADTYLEFGPADTNRAAAEEAACRSASFFARCSSFFKRCSCLRLARSIEVRMLDFPLIHKYPKRFRAVASAEADEAADIFLRHS